MHEGKQQGSSSSWQTGATRRRALRCALAIAVTGLGGAGMWLNGSHAAPPPASAEEGAVWGRNAGSAGLAQSPAYAQPLREPSENALFWGDLHLHTRLSMDAYINGTRRVGQEEAYRFAMGETVIADNGEPARLRRPLDFLAVADHAESIGLFARMDRGDPIAQSAVGKRYSGILKLVEQLGLRAAFGADMRANGPMPDVPDDFRHSVWGEVARTADAYNRPGRFTALIGYEWTSMIAGDNLHRVVLFRDGAAKASQVTPVNAQKDPDPESLWAALARYESGHGGKVLAIAHNGNVSNGRMFAPQRINGAAIDRDYAQRRARWEPVYEVTQVKGDGETHPVLSPTDEFADFERWDQWNVARSKRKEPGMLRYEYARQALRDGLAYEQRLGANPYRFGLVGGSDMHTGLAATAEDNFFGKFKSSEPAPGRYAPDEPEGESGNWELGASGLTAIWAPENTREALFDALRRREVYATTGSRIRLRFFGGWDFAPGDIDKADYARHGYRRGVPMGSDLPRVEDHGAPTFLVHAARDRDGANLDRVQIVKGWVDAAGDTHETIHDVALSDDRRPGPDGKVPAVGSTVDVKNASFTNAIGDPELATWWRDPDFDPRYPAFYYVRVLEIPRPRWSTYDAAFYSTPLSDKVPPTLQDRAYSSPIWYRP